LSRWAPGRRLYHPPGLPGCRHVGPPWRMPGTCAPWRKMGFCLSNNQPGSRTGRSRTLGGAMTRTGGSSMCSARCVAFGLLQDGREIQVVELVHPTGLRARILTLGATLQSLQVPDRQGVLADVV